MVKKNNKLKIGILIALLMGISIYIGSTKFPDSFIADSSPTIEFEASSESQCVSQNAGVWVNPSDISICRANNHLISGGVRCICDLIA